MNFREMLKTYFSIILMNNLQPRTSEATLFKPIQSRSFDIIKYMIKYKTSIQLLFTVYCKSFHSTKFQLRNDLKYVIYYII